LTSIWKSFPERTLTDAKRWAALLSVEEWRLVDGFNRFRKLEFLLMNYREERRVTVGFSVPLTTACKSSSFIFCSFQREEEKAPSILTKTGPLSTDAHEGLVIQ
jgi:hypothetical protein